ncbi:hypothetical protein LACR_1839 [Lactococcus cremoris subsp. cremoris SK11]|uniref:Uncharacterized protein n=1 Tax=Lactococcus lactis subsp. cremoris (strain SK11) TaxID=272622 RepID=Q02XJ5_LACLS|nr:hypothetical protein LACR_1839 [Lactococcus cremoris subsp. cremoris SK11]
MIDKRGIFPLFLSNKHFFEFEFFIKQEKFTIVRQVSIKRKQC